MRIVTLALLLAIGTTTRATEPLILPLWPNQPPGNSPPAGPERWVEPKAGEKPVKRLTDVSRPTLTVYRPAADKDTGTAVIVCPGGGHRILAWDLEGTEVAEWLNRLGVTAFVLKYRVPAPDPNRRYLAAVQDAQRAVSLVRSRAAEWKLDPQRIGILGFSAGGETAALTALFAQRQYAELDAVDRNASRPNFAVLVYPGGLTETDNSRLRPHVQVDAQTPPMFFAHAADDRVAPENSVLLFLELKKAKIPAELHVYAQGGHGFGLRPSADPCSSWPDRCADWMKRQGWLKPAPRQ